MNDRKRVFNWQEAHARLERTRNTLQNWGDLSQEEAARILKHRASALASPPEDADPESELLQLVVLTLSGERLGIETAHVLEAANLQEVIHVPCTPPFITGVTHYRGRILSVLDLRHLLDLPVKNEDVTEGRRFIAVGAGGMTFGIAADAVGGILEISTHKVTPPSASLSGLAASIIRGMTDELITILDLEALVRAPGVLINDEVK